MTIYPLRDTLENKCDSNDDFRNHHQNSSHNYDQTIRRQSSLNTSTHYKQQVAYNT
jgi:hypothetical protein